MYHSSKSLRPMTEDELHSYNDKMHLNINKEEFEHLLQIVNGNIMGLASLDKFEEVLNTVEYRRNIIPTNTNNYLDYNDWAAKCNCEINSNLKEGEKLQGKTCIIKDNTFVEGVPCQNGSALLQGFVPNEDAEVVKRLLKAGVDIKGKSKCEDLCFSGVNFTYINGSVLNPIDISISTAGSSSGSASLVKSGFVDVALGGDQGGSIRISSASFKVIGLKPTYGLIPLTGDLGIEYTIDHVGPHAMNTENIARFMDASAGTDGIDQRYFQYLRRSPFNLDNIMPTLLEGKDEGKNSSNSSHYTQFELDNKFYYGVKSHTVNFQAAWKNYKSLTTGGFADGKKLSIGLLKEGLTGLNDHFKVNWNESFLPLLEKTCKESNIKVEEFSDPAHTKCGGLFFPIITLGNVDYFNQQCVLTNHFENTSSQLAKFLGTRKDTIKLLSHTNKICLLSVQFYKDKYGNSAYAMANNLRRIYTDEFMKSFEKYDFIILPTITQIPTNPKEGVDITKYYTKVFTNVSNTCPYNVLGLPAITIDLFHFSKEKKSSFCPIMIVGRHFEDHRVIQFARFIEDMARKHYSR